MSASSDRIFSSDDGCDVGDILILCYHAVSERWPAPLSVTPQRLETQLEFLVRNGYQGITFTEAATDAPAGKVLAVTFDDGYRSVVTLALPILERLGLPGTVFVPTDHVGTEKPMVWSGLEQWVGTEHEQELVCASWRELDGLVQSGWEIGGHTRTHPHLTGIDDAAILEELVGSRRAIDEHLGGRCTSMAYPYGDYDERVAAAAAQAGFLAAGTLPIHWRGPEPLRWPRIYVGHRDDAWRYRLKVSRSVRSARSTAGRALDHATAAIRRSPATRI